MKFGLVLALALLPIEAANAAVVSVQVHEPRTFGYLIGDIIERHVEVITDGSTELAAAALPRPGALTYWLDLVAVDHREHDEGGHRVYDVTLKYQTFYSALEAVNLDIPPLTVTFRDPGAAAAPGISPSPEQNAQQGEPTATVPALRITMSPLRNIVLDDLMPEKTKDISEVMRPDIVPTPVDTKPLTRALAAAIAALAASSVLLLWHHAVWPFGRRGGRPFTRASRQLFNGLGARGVTYGQALLILHRAFDTAAGQRLFAEDLADFARKRKEFSAELPQMKNFFDSSRLYFFSNDPASAQDWFPLEDVRQLATDLARDERSAA